MSRQCSAIFFYFFFLLSLIDSKHHPFVGVILGEDREWVRKDGTLLCSLFEAFPLWKWKRKIIAKHERLSFYYHNNKLLAPWHEWLWHGHARNVNFPDFSRSFLFTLLAFEASTWHFHVKNKENSRKFSLLSRKFFLFSSREGAAHSLSVVRHTRSLSVQLSFAQHKSRKSSWCSQIFFFFCAKSCSKQKNDGNLWARKCLNSS